MYSSKVIAGVDIATADQYNRLRTDAMLSSYLLVHAQNTANNTFRVESGFWYNGTTRVDVALLSSTTVTAPVTSTRIDLVSVNTSGAVVVTAGVEGGSAPAIPAGNFVLAEIHCRVGGTTVLDTDDSVNHYIVDRRGGFVLTAIDNDQMTATATTGTSSAYLLANATYSAYVDKDIFIVQFHTANTINPTINVNNKGYKAIVDSTNTGLTASVLSVNTAYILMYNSSLGKMVVVGSLGGGSSSTTPSTMTATNSPVDGYVAVKGTGVDQFTWTALPVSSLTAYSILTGTMTGTTPVVVSDSRIQTNTPFNVYFNTQPVGNVTRTLGAGTITLVSDSASDTMAFTLVVFGFGNKTTYVQSTTQTLNGAGPWTITDSRITATTPVNLFPATAPTGFLTIESQAGSVLISSSASETNLNVTYIGFTDINTVGAKYTTSTSKTVGTTYQAGPTGGMLVGIVVGTGSGISMYAYSDSSSTPTTEVAGVSHVDNTAQRGTLTVPILPNMYYKVTGATTVNFYE